METERAAPSLGELTDQIAELPPQARESLLRRVRRARWKDIKTLAYEALPDYFDPARGSSAFHEAIFATLRSLPGAAGAIRTAWEAPRGHAKSVIGGLLLPLACCLEPAVYGIRYILVVRVKYQLAEEQVAEIRDVLATNRQIRGVYGDLRTSDWNRGDFITTTGVRVQAIGADTAMRGLRWGPYRPQLAIVDDLDKDAVSRQARVKLRRWIERALMGLSDTARPMHVLAFGTRVDADAVIAWLAQDAVGWNGHTYRAVERWPDERDGLWRHWEDIYSADDTPGHAEARAFYEGHRAAMDKGAEVLWAGDDLYSNMEFLVVNGPGAHGSEKQNDPRSGEDALVYADELSWWNDDETDDWRPREGSWHGSESRSLGFRAVVVDPSMGKLGGDFTAIVGGGLADDGTIYGLGVDVARMKPDQIVPRAVDMAEAIGAEMLRVEAVGGFELLAAPMLAEVQRRGLPMAVEDFKPSTDKHARLQSLQPLLRSGRIVLHRCMAGSALDQLLALREDGSTVDHDDFPDALHMLKDALSHGSGRMPDKHRNGNGNRNGNRDRLRVADWNGDGGWEGDGDPPRRRRNGHRNGSARFDDLF